MKAPGLHNRFPARPDDPDERPAITPDERSGQSSRPRVGMRAGLGSVPVVA